MTHLGHDPTRSVLSPDRRSAVEPEYSEYNQSDSQPRCAATLTHGVPSHPTRLATPAPLLPRSAAARRANRRVAPHLLLRFARSRSSPSSAVSPPSRRRCTAASSPTTPSAPRCVVTATARASDSLGEDNPEINRATTSGRLAHLGAPRGPPACTTRSPTTAPTPHLGVGPRRQYVEIRNVVVTSVLGKKDATSNHWLTVRAPGLTEYAGIEVFDMNSFESCAPPAPPERARARASTDAVPLPRPSQARSAT